MSIGYQVWVMGLVGGIITWDASNWGLEPRLLAIDCNIAPGSAGDMSFHLMRAYRADSPSVGYITDAFTPVRGQYVAITDLTSTGPGSGVGVDVCFGVFAPSVRRAVFNSTDFIGQVTARECGLVLDQVPVINLVEEDISGTLHNGYQMDSPPTFNIAGYIEGEILGNMVAGLDGNPQFANDPTHCNDTTAVWDRWSMLEHVIAYVANYSPQLPVITLGVVQAAVQTFLSVPFLEVIPTEGLTLKGFLDLIVGPARGLFWQLVINTSGGWDLNILSATEGIGAIPGATTVNVDLTGLEVDVIYHDSAFDQYDAVSIDGNRHIFCGTVSPIDNTLDLGWSTTQEAAYQAGASGLALGWATSNLHWDQRQALNNQVRSQGLLRDVYTRFILKQDAGGALNCKAVSGVPVAGSTQFLCPSIDWNGTAATVDNSTDETPNVPEARLQGSLPWPCGLQGNGTDLRSVEQQSRPSYLEPMVFSYQHPAFYKTTDSYETAWVDLCHPPTSQWNATPSVSIGDRGPSINIAYSPAYLLGKTHYTHSAYDEFPSGATSAEGADNALCDWQKLAATIAIQGDQRVRVTNYRSGYSAANVRNTMHVRRADLNCWVVRAHTFIGMSLATGLLVPDEIPADIFVRNDYAVAQKLCDEIGAFAFRARTGVTITLEGATAFTAWSEIGLMIGTLTESNGSTTTTINTIVTNIHVNFSEQAPRIVITTSDPPLPESYALEKLVPAMGGPVSVALGATLAAHSLKMEESVKRIDKMMSGGSVVSAFNNGAPKPLYGYVQWNWTGGVDLSQVELCQSDGTRASPALIGYIDSTQSDLPASCGNIFYRLEYLGITTRSGAPQRTYRATMAMGRNGTDGLGVVPYSGKLIAAVSAPYWTATACDSTGAPILTTINGSVVNNVFILDTTNVPAASITAGFQVVL
jgi:hypothetical protein